MKIFNYNIYARDTAQISQYAVWSTNLSHKIEFGAFFALV